MALPFGQMMCMGFARIWQTHAWHHFTCFASHSEKLNLLKIFAGISLRAGATDERRIISQQGAFTLPIRKVANSARQLGLSISGLSKGGMLVTVGEQSEHVPIGVEVRFIH